MTYSSLTSNKLHQNNNNDRVSKNKCIKLSSKTMNHIQRICSEFRNNKNYHQDTYHNENYNRLMTTTNTSYLSQVTPIISNNNYINLNNLNSYTNIKI